MAVNISAVVNGVSKYTRSFDVIASADADTTADIAHGLSGLGTPDQELQVSLEPRHAAFYTSTWVVTSLDQGAAKTTVRLTKGTGAGSGNAAVQVRVHVRQFHSIER